MVIVVVGLNEMRECMGMGGINVRICWLSGLWLWTRVDEGRVGVCTAMRYV